MKRAREVGGEHEERQPRARLARALLDRQIDVPAERNLPSGQSAAFLGTFRGRMQPTATLANPRASLPAPMRTRQEINSAPAIVTNRLRAGPQVDNDSFAVLLSLQHQARDLEHARRRLEQEIQQRRGLLRQQYLAGSPREEPTSARAGTCAETFGGALSRIGSSSYGHVAPSAFPDLMRDSLDPLQLERNTRIRRLMLDKEISDIEQQMRRRLLAGVSVPGIHNLSASPPVAASHELPLPLQSAPAQASLRSLLAGPASSAVLAQSIKHVSIPLKLPSDEHQLSPYQIMLREQLELFVAQDSDVELSVQGRKKKVQVGQVGIRCVHCQKVASRCRPRGAVYYPARLEGVYQAAQNMGNTHLLDACDMVPSDIRTEMQRLRDRRDTATGGKAYWAATCHQVGVFQMAEGLRLRPGAATASL